MSKKNASDIRNRARDLPASSTVPQPTALPRTTERSLASAGNQTLNQPAQTLFTVLITLFRLQKVIIIIIIIIIITASN
jgi:hypothetical protein